MIWVNRFDAPARGKPGGRSAGRHDLPRSADAPGSTNHQRRSAHPPQQSSHRPRPVARPQACRCSRSRESSNAASPRAAVAHCPATCCANRHGARWRRVRHSVAGSGCPGSDWPARVRWGRCAPAACPGKPPSAPAPGPNPSPARCGWRWGRAEGQHRLLKKLLLSHKAALASRPWPNSKLPPKHRCRHRQSGAGDSCAWQWPANSVKGREQTGRPSADRRSNVGVVLDLVEVEVLVHRAAGTREHAHVGHVLGFGRNASELGGDGGQFGRA